jgi:hypothetical protein
LCCWSNRNKKKKKYNYMSWFVHKTKGVSSLLEFTATTETRNSSPLSSFGRNNLSLLLHSCQKKIDLILFQTQTSSFCNLAQNRIFFLGSKLRPPPFAV